MFDKQNVTHTDLYQLKLARKFASLCISHNAVIRVLLETISLIHLIRQFLIKGYV